MAGIKRLASIRLVEGGSLTQNALTLSSKQVPALAPDVLEIGGNLTSSEEFEVELVQPAVGNCQRILLAATSPAIYRVAPVGSLQPAQELRNIFQPVPANLATQFIVRVVDDTGRSQYVATCPEAQTAGYVGTQPYLDIDAVNTPLLTSQQTQTQGGISGYASGRAWVNPVQIVRWEITTSTLEAQNQAQYANALDNLSTQYGTIDPNKYDLMRTYVDATGAPVPQTAEMIAEYAVDLDFAFSVDTSILNGVPNIATFAFEDNTNNDAWSYGVDTKPVSVIGPQRIRQVRARVVTRTAMGDRTVNVPVANYGAEAYTYRYCINASPSCTTNNGVLRWARARTVTTEVSLPNLARDFFDERSRVNDPLPSRLQAACIPPPPRGRRGDVHRVDDDRGPGVGRGVRARGRPERGEDER